MGKQKGQSYNYYVDYRQSLDCIIKHLYHYTYYTSNGYILDCQRPIFHCQRPAPQFLLLWWTHPRKHCYSCAKCRLIPELHCYSKESESDLGRKAFISSCPSSTMDLLLLREFLHKPFFHHYQGWVYQEIPRDEIFQSTPLTTAAKQILPILCSENVPHCLEPKSRGPRGMI